MQRSISLGAGLNKSPTLPSSGITASASFQSHLSTVNAAHRKLRTAQSPVDDLEKQGLSEQHDRIFTPAVSSPHRSQIAEAKTRIKWAILLFASFSAIFLPISVLQTFNYIPCGLICIIRRSKEDGISYQLDLTKNSLFLSKITSLGSDTSMVHPFAIRGISRPDEITACLWSRFEEVEKVLSWIKKWPGPTSLVLTTTTSQQSAQHDNLLDRVSQLYSRKPSNSSLSVHLLHVNSSAQENPNAYINLARLLAETDRILLLPRPLLSIEPQTAYAMLIKHTSLSHSSRPTILTASGHTTFPFSPFSPVLLHRNDSVWCDERFALTSSGAFDWEECIWQFWLAKYGSIKVLPISESSWPMESSVSETAVRSAIRNHLQTRFREETCLLATRHINAFITGEGREAHPEHLKQNKWLKRTCKQWKFVGV